eukprot:TRINITY_DN4480_c0_g1_i1.p1 TRINITY_DN4480_c0_g1~~TRINITY_DN4480_c0_g1_i1.p1  ORF type:complete len:260 (-),score=101.16 TRINITY_DN4480_c0_g1_i1:68-847(-)
MIRRPPRSTHCISSAASDVYKRQGNNITKAIDSTEYFDPLNGYEQSQQKQEPQNNNLNAEEQQEQQQGKEMLEGGEKEEEEEEEGEEELDQQKNKVNDNQNLEIPQVMDYSEALMIQNQDQNEAIDPALTNELFNDEQINGKKNYNEQEKKENQVTQNSFQQQSKNMKKRPCSARNYPIPYITQNGYIDAYKELKRVLLNIIQDYALFDKKKIMELSAQAKRNNPHLDKAKIIEICKDIIYNLYGDCLLYTSPSPRDQA